MAESLYRALCAILMEHGCVFVRQGKGSHEIWLAPVNGKKFSVPFTIKRVPTANAILKQAGIDRKI